MKAYQAALPGPLDIFVGDHEHEEAAGETQRWQRILIYTARGLRSFARLLLRQDELPALPPGGREHVALRPGFDLSHSSVAVIAGRLDTKGSGAFYERYVAESDAAQGGPVAAAPPARAF